MTSEEKIKLEIQKEPLVSRLIKSKKIVSNLCSEKRPPRMSIPLNARDEDVFLARTLEDALEILETVNEEKRFIQGKIAALNQAKQLIEFPVLNFSGDSAYQLYLNLYLKMCDSIDRLILDLQGELSD